jgi:hypothetical protein
VRRAPPRSFFLWQPHARHQAGRSSIVWTSSTVLKCAAAELNRSSRTSQPPSHAPILSGTRPGSTASTTCANACGYVCDEEEIMQPASGVGLRGYVEAGFRFPRLVGAAVGRLDIKAEHAVGSDGHNQRVAERVRYYRTIYPCLSLISKLHSATNVCGPSCMRRWEITVDARSSMPATVT